MKITYVVLSAVDGKRRVNYVFPIYHLGILSHLLPVDTNNVDFAKSLDMLYIVQKI